MSQGHSLLDTITDTMAPVHRDGHKFVAIGLAVTLVLFLIWQPLAWVMALITCWIIYFFRDPDRVTPLREGLIISPADGRVSLIETVSPPEALGIGTEERVRVSVFLSVFDVHIQRAPLAGRIIKSIYHPGAFLNAALDKASEENERRTIVIETAQGVKIACVQIAGLVARRIVTFATEGENIGVGERFGSSGSARASIPICLSAPCRSCRSASARSAARRCSPIRPRKSPSAKRGSTKPERGARKHQNSRPGGGERRLPRPAQGDGNGSDRAPA